MRLRIFLGQEHRDVPDKPFRILVLRAVIGVRVEDQLGVGDVLLEDVRVDRVDDHVVVAVDDQRRLMERLQIVEGVCARGAPLGECFELRRRHLLVHLGIAALSAPTEAFQIGAASCLAGFGWGEEDAKPQMVRRVVSRAENLLRSGVNEAMLSPLRGPVPTSTRRRTSSGAARANSCATRPPREKPSTSTWLRPSALMKASALAAIPSTEVGTSPELLEMPALSNRTTSPSLAKPSVTSGSQWSMVPVKCMLKTSGTPEALPKRR